MERMTRMAVGMACILALALAPACWGAQDLAQGPGEDLADSGAQAGEAVERVSEIAYMDTDYEDADFTYSGTLRGPLVGFAFEM